MTVEHGRVVDAIGVERATGTVVLTIFDHLTWEDERAHLVTLQAKLNAYLAYLESGEVYNSYAESHGRAFRIDIVFLHSPTPAAVAAVEFLQEVRGTIAAAGFDLSWRQSPDHPDSP
jgi:hypothetical protein